MSLYLPLQSADPTTDVLGNAADYTGQAPRNRLLKNSPCGTFDGVDDYVAVASLVGTETVASHGGTATVTISAGQIDATAGTVWDLELSNGSIYPFSENSGDQVHDVSGNDHHGTANGITEASFWGTTQDEYHYAANNGESKYTHATLDPRYVPYDDSGPLTITPPTGYTLDSHNPAGDGLNTPNTEIDFDTEPNAPWTRGLILPSDYTKGDDDTADLIVGSLNPDADFSITGNVAKYATTTVVPPVTQTSGRHLMMGCV